MQNLCPHCYAEILDHSDECFSCGGFVPQGLSSTSKLELAGQELTEWFYDRLPLGALLDKQLWHERRDKAVGCDGGVDRDPMPDARPRHGQHERLLHVW